jgi:hypothetical protein
MTPAEEEDDKTVKSLEGLSINVVNSGSSLHASADTSITKPASLTTQLTKQPIETQQSAQPQKPPLMEANSGPCYHPSQKLRRSYHCPNRTSIILLAAQINKGRGEKSPPAFKDRLGPAGLFDHGGVQGSFLAAA